MIINDLQSAFVPGRDVHDTTLAHTFADWDPDETALAQRIGTNNVGHS